MLEGILGRLRDAIFGRRDYELEVTDIINTDTDPKNSMVRFLRQLPSDDKAKKRALSDFFNTPEGGSYSSEERQRAYDELLGVQRNRETIG